MDVSTDFHGSFRGTKSVSMGPKFTSMETSRDVGENRFTSVLISTEVGGSRFYVHRS